MYLKKVLKIIVLFYFICILSCDRISYPKIINGYNYEINLNIIYKNGYKTSGMVPAFTKIVNRVDHGEVDNFKILTKSNEVIAEYNNDFLEKVRKEQNLENTKKELWVVTEKGLYLIPNKYQNNGSWKEYIEKMPPNRVDNHQKIDMINGF